MTMPSDPQAVLTRRPPSVEQYDELARALAESEERVRVLEAALTRCAEYGHAQADLGSKHHERFIDDWRDCPARSCVAARAALSEPETPR